MHNPLAVKEAHGCGNLKGCHSNCTEVCSALMKWVSGCPEPTLHHSILHIKAIVKVRYTILWYENQIDMQLSHATKHSS